MPQCGGRSATRKPLLDVPNGREHPAPGERKKRSAAAGSSCAGGGGCDLDLLLLARSDLSNLVGQVDELVAQALEKRKMSQTGSLAIESFRHALRDMQSSLQAWIPRLKHAMDSEIIEKLEQAMDSSHSEFTEKPKQAIGSSHVHAELGGRKTVAIDGKNDDEHTLVVSPSPFVSWRGNNCMVDCGRQLFLLTPLPKSRAKALLALPCEPLISLQVNGNGNEALAEAKAAEAQFEFPRLHALVGESKSKTLFFSPLVFSNVKGKSSSISMLTSGANTSPAKKETTLVNDDPASEEAADNLASRYQELLGIQTANGIASQRQDSDESLDWFLSPPKTCVLMEPSDNKLGISTPKAVCLPTPMVKGFEISTVRKGKQPGEATLKRELWTKFEAVSSSELILNASVLRRTARKGFMEMLEEASCE